MSNSGVEAVLFIIANLKACQDILLLLSRRNENPTPTASVRRFPPMSSAICPDECPPHSHHVNGWRQRDISAGNEE